MMGLHLSARDKRALKALAIAIGVAAIWLGHDATTTSSPPTASIEALEQRYMLAREKAARLPGRERDARTLVRALQVLESRLLAAESPSLAQAEIRSISTKLLSEAGIGSPASAFGSAGSSTDSYIGIPLDLEFVCRTDQFVSFMAGLAGAGPILATRDVRISVESAEAKTIRVQLTVEGYLRSDGTEPPVPEIARGLDEG